MEGQSSTGQSQYQYQSAQWSRLVRRNTLAATPPPLPSPTLVQSHQVSTTIEIFPSLLPQQTVAYQAQLAQYNKLITSGRATRVQSSPLPPLLSAQHIQAVPRSGPSGYDNSKRRRSTSRIGHGNKKSQHTGNGERPLIAEHTPTSMSSKKSDMHKQLSRPQQQHSALNQQSSSVPSTPHQHPRKFSIGSREPSPIAAPNQSPRSAYSESHSTFPHRPAQRGVCRYETGMAHFRRRMPYKLGSDKLEKVKTSTIKEKLTPEEDKRLTAEMRELYEKDLLPSNESTSRRQKFVQKLKDLLNKEWPGHNIDVHMFGSSGNMLCTDESDVDICITTDWKGLEDVCMLAELLGRPEIGMKDVLCVSTAKVPIVKILDPELNLKCDMNVNNTLALENTRMIKTYIQIDERVRPLAMIIKYWTKRRILNDAAFGGTLSSYTWICMIINFLQTRKPPVLPALHQMAPKKDGHGSPFFDDLDVLRNFGKENPNKESLGQLLFQFFRFYAHEIDYDEVVVSVRAGALISKREKQWHLANNNRLCVEESFNTYRNLGNTADDFSFRGLHLELRRAFDLIAETKLKECCEQYEYPKEEERIWERAPPTSRPAVLSRSTSQTRGGRGGGNGQRGRHNNHNRNGQTGRRASSVTFDGTNGYPLQPLAQGLSANETWLQTQQAQAQLHNDLYNTMSVLQAQENNLRLQLYHQSQAFAQAHAQAQANAYSHTQRLHQSNNITTQHATDRSRGNSFDNPPLTAPLRPEMYFYPLQYAPPPSGIYGQQSNPSTYPSSPAMTPALPELRRSLHRSTVTGGSGVTSNASNGTLRSHSQPASRSSLSPLAFQYPTIPVYQHIQQTNGVPIPNYIGNENSDSALESDMTSSRAESSPDDVMPKEYLGYYVNGSPPAQTYQPQAESLSHSRGLGFGEVDPNRRRLSTDQFPQAILDRLRRTSRSPSPHSPLGRDRTYSGTRSAPLGSGPFPQVVSSSNVRALNEQAPLIVNGSFSVPISQHTSAGPSSISGASTSDDHGYDTPGASIDSFQLTPSGYVDSSYGASVGLGVSMPTEAGLSESNYARVIPAVRANDGQEFPQGHQPPPKGLAPLEISNGPGRISPNTRTRIPRQQQNGAMSPLDITHNHTELIRDDVPHLSPVYETRSPSPTANRKFDPNAATPQNTLADSNRVLKIAVDNAQKSLGSPVEKSNGHTRGSKSEGAGPGSWQQISKGKKKSQAADTKSKYNGALITHCEQTPKNELDRKGG